MLNGEYNVKILTILWERKFKSVLANLETRINILEFTFR